MAINGSGGNCLPSSISVVIEQLNKLATAKALEDDVTDEELLQAVEQDFDGPQIYPYLGSVGPRRAPGNVAKQKKPQKKR